MLILLKKIIAIGVAANLMFASSAVFAGDLNLTPKQEVAASQAAIRFVGWNCYEEQNFTYMLHHIVESNPDKLRHYTNGTQRGIPHIYIMTNPMNNSYTSIGGDIIFSADWVNKLLYNKATGAVEAIGQPSYYRQSALAAVVAHECSHWYHADGITDMNKIFSTNQKAKERAAVHIKNNNFSALIALQEKTIGSADISFIESYRQYSMAKEDRADLEGMDFINNDWRYSIGGMAMFLKTSDDMGLGAGSSDVNEHKSASVRYNAVIDHIKELSFGRVEIRNDLLYLDGKKFMGTGKLPARKDVTSYDRTMFVAGQLASSINRNLGLPSDKDGIIISGNMHYYKILGNKTLLLSNNSTTQGKKILDEVDVAPERLAKIVDKTIAPSNDEERAVVEMVDFLHRDR